MSLQPPLEQASAQATGETVGLQALIGRIAHDVDRVLGTGDVAELRRTRPTDIGQPAFWRIVAMHLEPGGALPAGGDARDAAERRWAVLLSAMAAMQRLHQPRLRLGRALESAGVAEQRVLRLLRAHDDALADAVRVTIHQLAQRAQPVDMTDVAKLVLSDGRRDEESVRRSIARDFYAASYRKEKESES